MEEDWEIARELFRDKVKRFPNDRGADARESQARQEEIWSDLLNSLRDGLTQGPISNSGEIIDALKEAICSIKNFRLRSLSDGHLVDSIFPVLSENPQPIRDAIHAVKILAALFYECRDGLIIRSIQNTDIPAVLNRAYHPVLFAAMSDYARHVALNELKVSVDEMLGASLAEFNIKDLQADTMLSELGLYVERLKSLEASQKDSLSSQLAESSKSLDDLLLEARNELIALKESVVEQKFFQGAGAVWNSKKRSNNIAFTIWFLLLVVSIVGLLWVVQAKGPSLIEGVLVKKPDGDYTYGSLLLLLIPGLAILWLLRYFGRFAVNARTLADDASQRAAMMETYFRLMADKNAEMRPSDRILILNAIFRPLPGYQTEEVSPATLADLVKEAAGMEKK